MFYTKLGVRKASDYVGFPGRTDRRTERSSTLSARCPKLSHSPLRTDTQTNQHILQAGCIRTQSRSHIYTNIYRLLDKYF
jgi:hypothetical protein